MVARDAQTTTPSRPRARSIEIDAVASPAHVWEVVIPPYAASKPKSRGDAVKAIARMMAEGEWRTGVSARLLSPRWKMTVGSIQNVSAEASRMVKCVVDPSLLLRTVSESIERLMENGYAAREDDNINGSTVAFTKAAELCLTLAKDANPSDDRSQEDVHRALVAAGWTPPPTLLGLPAPSVMLPAERTAKEANDDDDDT